MNAFSQLSTSSDIVVAPSFFGLVAGATPVAGFGAGPPASAAEGAAERIISDMNVWQLLVLAALGGSIALFAKAPWQLLPLIACAVGAAEFLFAFRIVTLSIKGLNLTMVLGAALAVVGVLMWVRNTGRPGVTAATVVALVGAVQFLDAVM
jgi:hypothetical protein